jgi:hypothetical protein
MEIVRRTNIINWEDYIEEFSGYNESENFIFRGQSNSIKRIDPKKDEKGRVITTQTLEWELISSFNRYYEGSNQYNFATFLSQQLNDGLFINKYKHYEVLKKYPLHEWSTLDKLMFLQHYSCPTCLIDFTKNPLIALYFGMTAIKGSSGATFDGNGNIFNYSDDCFMSIYKIDCNILKNEIVIKDWNYSDDLFLKYRQHEYYLKESSPQSAVLSLFLSSKQPVDQNFNLDKQKGCFLLYDCNSFNLRGKGLEKFIEEYVSQRNIKLSQPVITIYKIRYNSIYGHNQNYFESKKTGLFGFLSDRKINGAYLFDDLQGLKYDFNYFHEH